MSTSTSLYRLRLKNRCCLIHKLKPRKSIFLPRDQLPKPSLLFFLIAQAVCPPHSSCHSRSNLSSCWSWSSSSSWSSHQFPFEFMFELELEFVFKLEFEYFAPVPVRVRVRECCDLGMWANLLLSRLSGHKSCCDFPHSRA